MCQVQSLQCEIHSVYKEVAVTTLVYKVSNVFSVLGTIKSQSCINGEQLIKPVRNTYQIEIRFLG